MSISSHTVRAAAEHALQCTPNDRPAYATLIYTTRMIRANLSLTVDQTFTANTMLAGAWYAWAAARPEWGVLTEQMAYVFWVQVSEYWKAGRAFNVPMLYQAMNDAMNIIAEVAQANHAGKLAAASAYTVGGKPISDHSI